MTKVKIIRINIITVISIFLLICAIVTNIIVFNEYRKNKENIELIESLQDTLTVTRGENGEHIARISVLETQNVENFTKLSLKDSKLIELQNEVDRYKRKLKEQGSVTIVETNTVIDSIWEYHPIGGDTIIFSESTLIDSIKNAWIDVEFGFIKGNSLFKLNKLTNKYTVAIGQDRNGLFKEPTSFVELTSYNPYTSVQHVRTYQVSLPKPKRYGLGIYIGYGLGLNDNKIILTPSAGVGISYNILQW